MNQSTQRIIRNKIGLLNLAEELGNVSKACQMMGVSRDTFYRYQSARDEVGDDNTHVEPPPVAKIPKWLHDYLDDGSDDDDEEDWL